MKIASSLLAFALVATLSIGCKDRAAEKRIAELESRLSQMEGNKGTANANPAATTPAPAPEEKPEGPLPVAQFASVEHDFGTINEGQKVKHVYKFKNTGEAPLIIQSAQPSCGCTAPNWSREPIPVGGEGFVEAEFDSQGKPGVQNKTIAVTANTWPKTTTLRFKAMVTAKPTGENGPTAK
ncbi:MAG: DUF1573 domain-containing protein [Cyclobacteriaceae bacterium]|jgi:hypothetical protein|nr:DUF1573 domain-containing protein [Cyclobacteriaceae bacterium]